MIRKLLKIILLLTLVLAAVASWLLLGGITHFEGNSKYFYIHTHQNSKQQVLAQLQADSIIKSIAVFNLVANQVDYYNNIKPGKYKIPKGIGVLKLVRMLHKGRQEEVRLVIGKVRLPEEFAQRLGRYIEQDSTAVYAFLTNPDSLAALSTDGNTWMTSILPNTYHIYWTHTPGTVLRKLKAESDKWWEKNDRKARAEKLGFTPAQIYTIASIVEEETNMSKDKPLVASVYINRLKKGMPLQADPTIRYARKDFEGNRVTFAHLRIPSPYNTYLNKGLPPGPICIPSLATIDSVLNTPDTDYLYFVARADFSGYSVFSSNFKDHGVAAKTYQDSLNAWLARKAAKPGNTATTPGR